jgi:polyhydroxybutyrate depolymerase
MMLVGCAGRAEGEPVADSEPVVDSGAIDSSTDTRAIGNVPGKYVHREKVDGFGREFIVYVPEKARGDAPVPVVFMLHGTSGDGEKFFNISHWREKADAEGLIAVFPSALTYCLYEDENRDGDFDDPGERKLTTKWASGKLGDPMVMPLCSAADLEKLTPDNRRLADHPVADDVAFFRFMLDALPKTYRIDSKRIYVSGFSNGASMSARLASELSERFAATGSHAGTLATPAKPAARPITMVLSVGAIDDRFTATALPIAESTLSAPIFATAVSELLTTAQLENKYAYDEVAAGPRKVARWTYATSTVGAGNRVVVALIEGCTHEYPNGINHPMVMADALWDVFKTQSLP